MTVAAIQRFFYLRPAMSWTIAVTFFLWFIILTVTWGGKVENTSFMDLEEFQMVELALQVEKSAPEMSLSDSPAETVIEEKPLRFGAIDDRYKNILNAATAPRPRFSSLPEYPDSMRHEGIEGIVVIELGINENGRVVYGKIVRSLGSKFDSLVIEWAKKINFYPARSLERKAFKCRVHQQVTFKLDS